MKVSYYDSLTGILGSLAMMLHVTIEVTKILNFGENTKNFKAFSMGLIADSKVLMGQKPDITDMFENVISYVGRVFVCTKDCKQGNITDVENCRGTVGLVGTNGESIGCWHTVEVALGQKGKGKYKVFIEYPNYGGPQSLMFEARIKDDLCSPELDLFVAEPVDPLKHKTTHLPCALDVSLADNVHCFGFLEVLDRKIIATYKNRKVVQGSEKCQVVEEPEIKRRLKLPAIFSGRVCFNGWKQAVADYLCFPNCSGGLVVDDWGCLKGIHVAAFRIGRKLRFHSLKVAKTKFKATQSKIDLQKSLQNLYDGVNTFCADTAFSLNASNSEIATFVPVQIFQESLQLARLRLIVQKGDDKPSSSIKFGRENVDPKKSCLQEGKDRQAFEQNLFTKCGHDQRPTKHPRGHDRLNKNSSKKRKCELKVESSSVKPMHLTGCVGSNRLDECKKQRCMSKCRHSLTFQPNYLRAHVRNERKKRRCKSKGKPSTIQCRFLKGGGQSNRNTSNKRRCKQKGELLATIQHMHLKEHRELGRDASKKGWPILKDEFSTIQPKKGCLETSTSTTKKRITSSKPSFWSLLACLIRK